MEQAATLPFLELLGGVGSWSGDPQPPLLQGLLGGCAALVLEVSGGWARIAGE